MASSSVATMQIDHSRWRDASRNLQGIRPRIVLPPPAPEPQPESATSEGARQQPKILERWASHRARESSAATVERRAHEAELSALSAASAPVLARAASLLQEIETSPTHGAPAGGGGEAGGRDLPVKVRASSLIQMWREIEAEGAGTPTPTHRGSGGHATAFSPIEERSESFEDDSGWESDLTAASVESEKEQAGVGRRTWNGTEQGGRKRSGWFGGSHAWLRGRQEVQKLMKRLEDERRRELESLAKQRHVSGFMHRSRMQTFLRYRSLLRQVPDQDLRPQSTARELDQLHRGIAILFLRQQFSPRPQQASTAVSTVETKSASHMSLPSNSIISESSDLNGPQPSTKYHEADVERDLDDIQSEKYSLASESEDLQEDSQHSDVAWEEASLQESDIDWERPTTSLNSHGEQDEVFIDEPNNDNDEQMLEANGMCLTSVSPSQRELESRREEMYNDLLETYSDNAEIRELLERRTVSTSLASDFRDRLNQVLLYSLQRQRLDDDSSIDEDEEQLVQSHDHEFDADYQVASSFSVMPLSSQTCVHSHNCECSSFDHPVVQMDVVLDMKSDIANIYHEMGELRKLLKSYVETNAFQYSVQQDVTTVVRRSVAIGNTSYSSELESTKKGSCCICYEKQIDSLLYRCGHMCTCFKCAHELQCGSGRCPVCNAPIVDVVRAYTEILIPN